MTERVKELIDMTSVPIEELQEKRNKTLKSIICDLCDLKIPQDKQVEIMKKIYDIEDLEQWIAAKLEDK